MNQEDSISIEDQLKNIKEFCYELGKDQALFIRPFYEFFRIPKELWDSLSDGKGENSQDNSKNSSVFKGSICSNAGEGLIAFRTSTGKIINWLEFKRELTIEYCPFFHIYLDHYSKAENENFYLFSLRIQSVLNPEFNKVINKRFSEFVKLTKKLRDEVKAKLPNFPKKIFFQNSESLEKRSKGIAKFLLTVANEKIYHCLALFDFINLPKHMHNSYLTYNPFEQFYNAYRFEINIKDTNELTNENQDDTFTLYNILITVTKKDMQNQITGYIVRRRFREFCDLHSILKKKFRKYKKPLPELPGKFVQILGKKMLENRQYKLENYLRLLVGYPDIFDCIEFRKFFLINPQQFSEFKVDKGSYYLSSMALKESNGEILF